MIIGNIIIKLMHAAEDVMGLKGINYNVFVLVRNGSE